MIKEINELILCTFFFVLFYLYYNIYIPILPSCGGDVPAVLLHSKNIAVFQNL